MLLSVFCTIRVIVDSVFFLLDDLFRSLVSIERINLCELSSSFCCCIYLFDPQFVSGARHECSSPNTRVRYFFRNYHVI